MENDIKPAGDCKYSFIANVIVEPAGIHLNKKLIIKFKLIKLLRWINFLEIKN